MNKEIIYIEPSDDITDVLSKLKNSDKKVVAIVPPKKPSVFLSSINVKLIARTAKAEKKAVVLVSTDDSLVKLAMGANLPVASSLKSRPVLPGEEPKAVEAKEKPEEEKAELEPEDEEDEEEPEKEPEEDEDENEDEDNDEKDDEEDDEDDDEETEEDEPEEEKAEPKKAEKASKKEKTKKKKAKGEAVPGIKGWIAEHKAWVVFGSLAVVLIGVFLFWAFKIAPNVKVKISVRTSSANFSESIKFATQPADEDADNGVFYLHEEKLEKEQTVKFTATGKKDMGEMASGQVNLIAYFLEPGSVSVPAGTKLSHGDFEYVTTDAVVIAGPARRTASAFKATCDNYSDDEFQIGIDYCQVSAVANVRAVAPGEDYNLSATSDGWHSSYNGVSVTGRTDITGGTSKIITVVQQSDIDLALEKMKGSDDSTNGKNELYGSLSETVMPIDASYEVKAIEPKSTPAVGEEVKEGVTPQLFSKTTFSVLTVDKVRIEEFIKKKANVEEGKQFYSVGEPFIEYFAKNSEGAYSAKLKTTYKVGPEISETEVFDKVRGEKIGRIEPILKDSFQGVSSVSFEKSFFWVNSVPSDPNKVQIELTVEEN